MDQESGHAFAGFSTSGALHDCSPDVGWAVDVSAFDLEGSISRSHDCCQDSVPHAIDLRPFSVSLRQAFPMRQLASSKHTN